MSTPVRLTVTIRTDVSDADWTVRWEAVFADGVKLTARRSEISPYSRRLQTHPRVYGAMSTFAPAEMDQEPHRGYSIPLTGRTPAEEQMAKEWRNWKNKVIKVARAELIRRIAAVLDVTIAPSQVTFDVNAGCSACPCSPGFIIKGVESLDDISSLWVTGVTY